MAAEERNVAPFSRSVSLIPRGTRHNPLDNQPVAHDPRVDELAAAAPHDVADYVRDVVVHLMPPLTSSLSSPAPLNADWNLGARKVTRSSATAHGAFPFGPPAERVLHRCSLGGGLGVAHGALHQI